MRVLALAALVAAGFLSACGHRADLERPPPMWGKPNPPPAPPEAQTAPEVSGLPGSPSVRRPSPPEGETTPPVQDNPTPAEPSKRVPSPQ